MILNIGPYHPSMQAVAWLNVTLDGEDIIVCEPILDYLHRGMGEIAANWTTMQYFSYVTHWDYLATVFIKAIKLNGPEQLGNIQVLKRASCIRVIILK